MNVRHHLRVSLRGLFGWSGLSVVVFGVLATVLTGRLLPFNILLWCIAGMLAGILGRGMAVVRGTPSPEVVALPVLPISTVARGFAEIAAGWLVLAVGSGAGVAGVAWVTGALNPLWLVVSLVAPLPFVVSGHAMSGGPAANLATALLRLVPTVLMVTVMSAMYAHGQMHLAWLLLVALVMVPLSLVGYLTPTIEGTVTNRAGTTPSPLAVSRRGRPRLRLYTRAAAVATHDARVWLLTAGAVVVLVVIRLLNPLPDAGLINAFMAELPAFGGLFACIAPLFRFSLPTRAHSVGAGAFSSGAERAYAVLPFAPWQIRRASLLASLVAVVLGWGLFMSAEWALDVLGGFEGSRFAVVFAWFGPTVAVVQLLLIAGAWKRVMVVVVGSPAILVGVLVGLRFSGVYGILFLLALCLWCLPLTFDLLRRPRSPVSQRRRRGISPTPAENLAVSDGFSSFDDRNLSRAPSVV